MYAHVRVGTRRGRRVAAVNSVKRGINESRRKKEEPVLSWDYETIQKRAIR